MSSIICVWNRGRGGEDRFNLMLMLLSLVSSSPFSCFLHISPHPLQTFRPYVTLYVLNHHQSHLSYSYFSFVVGGRRGDQLYQHRDSWREVPTSRLQILFWWTNRTELRRWNPHFFSDRQFFFVFSCPFSVWLSWVDEDKARVVERKLYRFIVILPFLPTAHHSAKRKSKARVTCSSWCPTQKDMTEPEWWNMFYTSSCSWWSVVQTTMDWGIEEFFEKFFVQFSLCSDVGISWNDFISQNPLLPISS